MDIRRVSSILSGSMVMVAGGLGTPAEGGSWSGDDGGIGGLAPPKAGDTGSGWLTTASTARLRCCLSEATVGGEAC